MPIRICERNTAPKKCKCGSRGFLVKKETEEYIVWECEDCGRTQKFIKGREIELPGFLEDPSWFNN
jgi:Zn finger protein HypA/HybF involved in hydrogenase expression